MSARQLLINEAMQAAAALIADMSIELQATNPTAAAGIQEQLEIGAFPVLIVQFDSQNPSIRLCFATPSDELRQVMVIDGLSSTRQ